MELSLSKRFGSGVLWSFAGTVISQVLGFLASLVTAHMLGRVHFGEIGMIQSTVGMMSVFAGMGLGLTATKHVAAFRKVAPRRAESIIAMSLTVSGFAGCLMAAALAYGATWAAESIYAPHLTLALRLASPLLLLGAINGVQTGILAGLESFKAITHVNFLRGLVSFPLAIVGVKFWGLEGAVGALVVSAAIGAAVGEIAVRQHCLKNGLHVRWQSAFKEASILGSFALPALLSGAAVGPVTWLANTILASQRNGYAELGLLNAANQCRAAAMFLPSILMQVALPLLSSSSDSSGETSTFARVLEGTHSVTIAVVFPLATLMMFLSDVIARAFGASFAPGGPVVTAVAFTVLILAVGAAASPAIQAKGRMWLAFAVNVSWGMITLAFVRLTANRSGALSVAYGSALGYLLTTIWIFLYLRRELPRGMLQRVFEALAVSLGLLTVSWAVGPSGRLIGAVPATILASYLSLTRLSSRRVRDSLWLRVATGARKSLTLLRREVLNQHGT